MQEAWLLRKRLEISLDEALELSSMDTTPLTPP